MLHCTVLNRMKLKKLVMTHFIAHIVKDVPIIDFMDRPLLFVICLWSLNIFKVVCTNPLLPAI